MKKHLLVLLLMIAVMLKGFAQSDTLQEKFSLPLLAVAAGEPIYVGREHTPYHPSIQGIAYFGSNDWQKGSIIYQDIPYNDVFLKYDLVADEVILRHFNGFTPVVLFTPRITSFTIGDKHFINLPPQEDNGFSGGIYEQLRIGPYSFFAKRSKLLSETIQSNSLDKHFIDQHTFYVSREGVFYSIKNDKALLKLLGSKEKEVKNWMKSKGIKFKSNPELTLLKIVTYLNQINL